MRRIAARWVNALSVTLAACCPDGAIAIVSGAEPVAASAVIELRATAEQGWADDWVAGPGRCAGHWYVEGIEGGSPALGTIDRCGRYQAPAVLPAKDQLEIAASEHGIGQCADCCATASLRLELAR